MKKSIAVAVVLALVSAPVFAAEKEKKEGAAMPSEQKGAAGAEGAGKGRDWSKIDKNNDHAIQPEEMEAWLQANPGPLAKSK